jgi:hypothetical protein
VNFRKPSQYLHLQRLNNCSLPAASPLKSEPATGVHNLLSLSLLKHVPPVYARLLALVQSCWLLSRYSLTQEHEHAVSYLVPDLCRWFVLSGSNRRADGAVIVADPADSHGKEDGGPHARFFAGYPALAGFSG